MKTKQRMMRNCSGGDLYPLWALPLVSGVRFAGEQLSHVSAGHCGLELSFMCNELRS